jgi:hypothetical protein
LLEAFKESDIVQMSRYGPALSMRKGLASPYLRANPSVSTCVFWRGVQVATPRPPGGFILRQASLSLSIRSVGWLQTQ